MRTGESLAMITEVFKTYEEARQFVRNYEDENGYKYNMLATSRGFRDKLLSLGHRRIHNGRENLPYLYVSNGPAVMGCALGGRVKEIYKGKEKANTSPKVTGKRKSGYSKYDSPDESGNVLPRCPAVIRIHSLTYFPDYPVPDGMSKEVLTKHQQNLRKEFSSETICEPCFFVEIDGCHSNHRKNADMIIDNKIIEMMQNLVERGYYTPSDIIEQLDKYYQTLPVKPDKSDPKFYPGVDRVRSLTYSHMMKLRNMEREKGFTSSLTEACQKMAVFANKTLTSYICSEDDVHFGQHDVYRVARSSPILTTPDAENRCRLDTGGVPYIILKTQLYECSHGAEYKHKFRDGYTPLERRRLNKEGMVMCSARCTLKEIALFPAYRVNPTGKDRVIRDAIMKKLKEDLRNRIAPYERGIAYAFPVADEHCGHFVKEIDGHLYLDEAVKSQIAELVTEGVRSVAEMKRHLKMFVKHMFGENDMPGPFNRKFRPSHQTIINLMYQAGAPIEEIIIDVKDPVSYTHASNYLHDKSDIEVGPVQDELQTAVSSVPDKNNERSGFEELLKTAAAEQMKQTAQLNSIKQEAGGSSHFVVQKQTECHTLLEEILQSVYVMSDMFRLRDLKELLKRVTKCLKEGTLMCDGIPVNENSKGDSVSQKSGETFPGATEATGVSETSEEPPTKLLIIDEHEKVTEVNVPNDCKSTEIVVYQGYDESGEEYIVVNENRGTEQDNKDGITVQSTGGDISTKSKDVERKDLIKVTCKDYFTTEQILKSLNIEIADKSPQLKMISSDKLSQKRCKNLSGSYDLETEKKIQEKEMLKYEKDKVTLSKMERKSFRPEGTVVTPKKKDTGQCKMSKSSHKKNTNESMEQTETQVMDVDNTCTVAEHDTEFTVPSKNSTELEKTSSVKLATAHTEKKGSEEELLIAKPLASGQTDHSYNRTVDSDRQNSSILIKHDVTNGGRETCIENVTDITFQFERMTKSGSATVDDVSGLNTPRKSNEHNVSHAIGGNASGANHQLKEAANKLQLEGINIDSVINEMMKSTKSARVAVFKVSQSPRMNTSNCDGNSYDMQKKVTRAEYVIQDSESNVSDDPDWSMRKLSMKKSGGQMHFSRKRKK